jgi:hypothetical protein
VSSFSKLLSLAQLVLQGGARPSAMPSISAAPIVSPNHPWRPPSQQDPTQSSHVQCRVSFPQLRNSHPRAPWRGLLMDDGGSSRNPREADFDCRPGAERGHPLSERGGRLYSIGSGHHSIGSDGRFHLSPIPHSSKRYEHRAERGTADARGSCRRLEAINGYGFNPPVSGSTCPSASGYSSTEGVSKQFYTTFNVSGLSKPIT